jgi:Flp pilus assembly protein TadG
VKNNQKGFGAVEGLLFLILLSILGFTGYYVYHTSINTNSTYSNAANTSQKASQISSDTDQSAKIKEAVKKECEATAGNTASGINIYKQQGDFAVATVSCGASAAQAITYRDYLKKSKEIWAVVLTGSGAPTTSEDLAPYGFPADFL